MKSLIKTLILGAIIIYGFSYFTKTNYFDMPGLSSAEDEIFEWREVKVWVKYADGTSKIVTHPMLALGELHALDEDGDGIKNLMVKCPDDELIQNLIGCNSILEYNITSFIEQDF